MTFCSICIHKKDSKSLRQTFVAGSDLSFLNVGLKVVPLLAEQNGGGRERGRGLAGTVQGFRQSFGGEGHSPQLMGTTKTTLKEDGDFGKRGDIGGIILGDNPTRHCFVFSSNDIFQIIHDCVTANACHRQNFW